MKLLLIMSLYLLPFASYAMQNPSYASVQDSVWDLESLGAPPDSIFGDIEDKNLKNEVFTLSKGWFPRPYNYKIEIASLWGGSLFTGNVLSSLNPAYLMIPKNPYLSNDPFADEDDKQIKKSFSDENEGYPFDEYTTGGFYLSFNPGLPFIVNSSIYYVDHDAVIYSFDKSKSFLNYDNNKAAFDEASVLFIDQDGIGLSAGIALPFWGAYVSSAGGGVGSAYYISVELHGDYFLDSDLLQYYQIANKKNELRYGNGSDTLTVLKADNPEGLNDFRWSFDLALGMSFESLFTMKFEAFYKQQITPFLKETDWRQYSIGIRFCFGFINFGK